MTGQPSRCGVWPFSRRAFLKGLGGGLLAGTMGFGRTARAALTRHPGPIARPDLLDDRSPAGMEVIQLTTETDVPSSHLYMEAQVFSPDSRRFVLHRSATAHGGDKNDPRHQYVRCDLDDGCSLHPLTEETGSTAASVSPDGKSLYYFVDETTVGGGRLILKRINLDGSDRQTIMVLDKPLPGTHYRPSGIYPLSTISSDGQRLALSAFLGDGQVPNGPFGLMVFDLVRATVRLVLHGPSWCNMHPQYCRSTDPEAARDILVQENHGNETTAAGETTQLTGGAGADIHVIRDDGTHFRDMPWGRDGNEFCQGHQCWRGRSTWAITSTGTNHPPEAQLIEGQAAPHADHIGIKTPGGIRNDVSRRFPNPHFYHFATNADGTRLVSDAGTMNRDATIYLAELGEPGTEPAQQFTYLLSPRSTCESRSHIHPFLAPDGTLAFFNSDESGQLQAYMIRGL